MAQKIKQDLALAVFVKTPEISPVKTRLSAQIGNERALIAYEKSLQAMTHLMQMAIEHIHPLSVYWAIGEQDGLESHRWSRFSKLWTGEGGLGDRLHFVYETLRQKHQRVILIGSDCPHLPLESLMTAAQSPHRIVIGPSTDGGFYLFAGDIEIKHTIWTSVRYSTSDTLSQLQSHFVDVDKDILPSLTDIDDKASLHAAIKEWQQKDPKSALAFAKAVKEKV